MTIWCQLISLLFFTDVCQFDYFPGEFMHCDIKCFCMNKALLLEFALELDPRNEVFNL